MISIGLFVTSICISYIRSVKKKKKEVHNSSHAVDNLEANCDCSDSPIYGTMPDYDRHLVVCVNNTDWPSHINEINTFPYNLVNKIDESSKSCDIRIKITACKINTSDSHHLKVIVFPEGLEFFIQESDFDFFSSVVTSKSSLLKHENVLNKIKNKRLSCKKLVLVCVHGSRDKRCGRAGPQIIEEMKNEISKQLLPQNEIIIAESSHIGGHKYAGTLVVYPDGLWYGHVSKRNAKELLENIINGTSFKKCLRGTWEKKLLSW